MTPADLGISAAILDDQTRIKTMFPFSSIDVSTLGGHTSTFFKVSSQHQDEWVNGIFHNSPYGIFRLGSDKGIVKLELISSGLNTPKFRKCKCEDELTALQKIRAWMDKF